MKEEKTKKVNKSEKSIKVKKEKKPKTKGKKLRFSQGLFEFDFTIFILVICLTIFGIVMVFSASYYYSLNMDGNPYSYLIKQGVWCALGIVVMLVISKIDYHLWGRWWMFAIGISILLLILVLTPLGITENGATRWLGIGGFTVMPGEIAKVCAIVGVAGFLASDPKRIFSFTKGVIPLLVLCAAYFALIWKQPNLSTAIVVVGIIVVMAIIAGLKMRYLAVVAIGAPTLLGFAYVTNILQPHQMARMVSFMDPFADELGNGYQVVQSLLALGSGGIVGAGLGNSIQKNLYLPEPQNDFILAILGEELGFIGVAVLLGVYIYFIYKGFKVAASAKDTLGMLLAGGVTAMLGLQVIINVAVVTSSMPCTGITLPFISYGGNAMIIWMAAMGILLNVSKSERQIGKLNESNS